jgi:hypothetical protein
VGQRRSSRPPFLLCGVFRTVARTTDASLLAGKRARDPPETGIATQAFQQARRRRRAHQRAACGRQPAQQTLRIRVPRRNPDCMKKKSTAP